MVIIHVFSLYISHKNGGHLFRRYPPSTEKERTDPKTDGLCSRKYYTVICLLCQSMVLVLTNMVIHLTSVELLAFMIHSYSVVLTNIVIHLPSLVLSVELVHFGTVVLSVWVVHLVDVILSTLMVTWRLWYYLLC